MSKYKILFQLTGSIAAYKACGLISRLRQEGYEVRVVATQSALRFVGEPTLEGLSGHPVYSDLWERGQAMSHIDLDRWADLIMVAPASANYINKIANGVADDLLSTLFLTHDFKKPFLIAPAMNQAMFLHPTTQKSLRRLSEMGIHILPSQNGQLACGEQGEGRLLEVDDLFLHIQKFFSPLLKPKVLVTAGGTEVPIDPVRSITNKSTGKTGAIIADELTRQGFQVTYLHSEKSILPLLPCTKFQFVTFDDLQDRLKNLLGENDYTAIIHTAAVSDFSVDFSSEKLSSDDATTLRLRKNPKLITHLREYSKNKNIHVIGFKLTAHADITQQVSSVEKLFFQSAPDVVVQNNVTDISDEPTRHRYRIYWSLQNVDFATSSQNLAWQLCQHLKEVPNDTCT